MSELTGLLVLLVVLLVCSAFFSGSETALLGVNWLRVRYLVRKGSRRARQLQVLLERDRRFGRSAKCPLRRS